MTDRITDDKLNWVEAEFESLKRTSVWEAIGFAREWLPRLADEVRKLREKLDTMWDSIQEGREWIVTCPGDIKRWRVIGTRSSDLSLLVVAVGDSEQRVYHMSASMVETEEAFRKGDRVQLPGGDAEWEVLGTRESDGYLCLHKLNDPEQQVCWVEPGFAKDI